MHAYICCKANKNNYGLCSSFSDEDELNDNFKYNESKMRFCKVVSLNHQITDL